MAGSTIGNAPSGENTSPNGTEKIPLSGSQFATLISVFNSMQWIAGLGTWTYSSDDSPTFVISTSVDNTGVIGVGYRIKLTQTTAKYFIVTAITSSTITVYGGTDYTLANAAITSPYYSPAKAPYGFPVDPNKWTVTTSDTGNAAKATPTAATWYGGALLTPTGASIVIPIGAWYVEYAATVDMTATLAAVGTVGGRVTLSTANNTESDATMSKSFATVFPIITGGVLRVPFNLSPAKKLVLTSKATYYLNMYSNVAAITNLGMRGDLFTTVISARSAYL